MQLEQGRVPVHFAFLILHRSQALLTLGAFRRFSVASVTEMAGDDAKLRFRCEDINGDGSDTDAVGMDAFRWWFSSMYSEPSIDLDCLCGNPKIRDSQELYRDKERRSILLSSRVRGDSRISSLACGVSAPLPTCYPAFTLAAEYIFKVPRKACIL